MEQLDFTVAKHYRVSKIVLDWASSILEVFIMDDLGVVMKIEYTGATATNFMIALNQANLSVKSLHRRIMERLMADGRVPNGNITGVP